MSTALNDLHRTRHNPANKGMAWRLKSRARLGLMKSGVYFTDYPSRVLRHGGMRVYHPDNSRPMRPVPTSPGITGVIGNLTGCIDTTAS
jgi:hypothetical protein